MSTTLSDRQISALRQIALDADRPSIEPSTWRSLLRLGLIVIRRRHAQSALVLTEAGETALAAVTAQAATRRDLLDDLDTLESLAIAGAQDLGETENFTAIDEAVKRLRAALSATV